MENLMAIIGWNGKNFEAVVHWNDDVIAATGPTLEAIKRETESALQFHFEEDPIVYDVAFYLRSSAILKELDGTLTRSAIAKATGLNEKRLGHYIQGNREGSEETRSKILEAVEGIKLKLESIL